MGVAIHNVKEKVNNKANMGTFLATGSSEKRTSEREKEKERHGRKSRRRMPRWTEREETKKR